MADDDDDKPWAEKHWLEQIWIVFWSIVGGVIALSIVALLIAAAVNETRWTFTTVNVERVCIPGRHGDCLSRTPGVVSSIDEDGFTVAIDRPPFHRYITSLTDPSPPVGTRVITEDWHHRLVSVVDSAHGRRHTNQWPKPRNDALEALAASAALLFIPSFLVVNWVVNWRKERRARAAGGSLLTERGAQPS